MAKKPAGLGRGLDELLSDNSPSARTNNTTVVIRTERPADVQFTKSDVYGTGTKTLYTPQHKNRSVKANFKNK